jgi:hypothetical protein
MIDLCIAALIHLSMQSNQAESDVTIRILLFTFLDALV